MKKYLTVAKCSMQVVLAYRNTYFISILISVFSMCLMISLWQAVYDGRSNIAGLSWKEMMTYLLIVFLLNTDVVSEYRCAKKVLDGSILMDLIKPIKHQEYTLSEVGSAILFGTFVNLILGTIIAFFLGAYVPTSLITWLAFLLSMINAVIIKLLIIYTSSLVSFWTHNIVGMMWARIAIVSFFSGALIPFNYFPGWLRSISEILPFQTIVHTPAQIFLSQVHSSQMIGLILLQILWIFVFWLLAKSIYYIGVRNIVVHGG